MKSIIEELWEVRDTLTQKSLEEPEIKKAILDTIDAMDEGQVRVAYKEGGEWKVNEWVKKAILLYFKTHGNYMMSAGIHRYYDKVPLKFDGWDNMKFQTAGIRVVPGANVRKGAYIGKGAVLMPSYVNIGAYVGEGSMIDTWATVGSCAHIGKDCHISGGAGIGGVLEPLQATPVIIGNNCFVGARSEVAEGVIVGDGCVISMGVFLGQSTRIYDREKDEVIFGRVPDGSVVVPGTLPSSDGKTHTYAAVIVKRVDHKTLSKTALNEILRG